MFLSRTLKSQKTSDVEAKFVLEQKIEQSKGSFLRDNGWEFSRTDENKQSSGSVSSKNLKQDEEKEIHI